MAGLFSSLFGGSKSEKDVKKITPMVADINQHFASFQSITNDQLRGKTNIFRQRIKDYLKEIDEEIASKNKQADELPYNDLLGKDAIYQEVEKLKKDRDEKIEEALEDILPEAFAVCLLYTSPSP